MNYRDQIPGNYQVEPYSLTSSKRAIFYCTYLILTVLTLTGVVVLAITHPLLFAVALLVSYALENIIFAFFHTLFHSAFIEIPENELGVLSFHSFVHHYRNIRVYHEKWLETRMSYFMDAKKPLKHPVFWTVLLPTLAAGLYFSTESVVLGLGFMGVLWLPTILQSIAHEWYHNDRRKQFYSKPTYYTLTLLEKIGLLSTKKHMKHHRHQDESLDEVDEWLDLYLPYGEKIGKSIWSSALKRYKPTERNMVKFVSKISYPVVFARPILLFLIFVGYFQF